jgi:hypothetical protein
MKFKFAPHVENRETILLHSADYFKNPILEGMLQTRGTAK